MKKITLTHKPKPTKPLDHSQSSELNVSVKQPILDNDIQVSIACIQLFFGKRPGAWFPALRIPPSDRNSQLYKYRMRSIWLVSCSAEGIWSCHVSNLVMLRCCCEKKKVMVRQVVKSCLWNIWSNPSDSTQLSYRLRWDLCSSKKDVGQLSRAQIIQ